VGAAIIGAYFGFRAKSTYDEATAPANCPTRSQCNQAGVDGVDAAHTQATIATVAVIGSVLLVAGAVALLVTAPPAKASGRSRLSSRVGGPFEVAF
jgi:hypothetical protein